MSGVRVGHVVLDVVDLPRAVAFWCAALGVEPVDEDETGVALPLPGGLTLDLLRVPAPTPGKNRVHLDLRPVREGGQDAEVARLLALGATRADVGQGPDVSWVVLADPEGTVFCVLRDPAPQRQVTA